MLPDLSFAVAEILGAALRGEFLKRGFRADFVVGWHKREEAFALLPPFAGYICLEAKPERSILFPLEFVREHHAGLHSFRSMRRMEARRRKARALWLRHSQSLASRRQRPSQAKVRSTIQRLGSATNPVA